MQRRDVLLSGTMTGVALLSARAFGQAAGTRWCSMAPTRAKRSSGQARHSNTNTRRTSPAVYRLPTR